MNSLYELPELDDLDYMGDTVAPMQAKANEVSTSFTFDDTILKNLLLSIYSNGLNADSPISPELFNEVERIINDATDKGLQKSNCKVTADFVEKIKCENAVFSAFKVHRMQNDIAKQLYDESGNIKSFWNWKNDVDPLLSHHVGTWLETEYNTAVIRANMAADWQRFENDSDVLPYLEWMPSTSAHPAADHRAYWGTILPVNHPFWSSHRPGDRWNCKCWLQNTDKNPTQVPSNVTGNQPDKGLDNNPGKDGKLFSGTHPYIANGYAGADAAKKRMLNVKNSAEFIPATSITEVEQRIKAIGIKEVNVSGASLEQLNLLLDTLTQEAGKKGLNIDKFIITDARGMKKITSDKAAACMNSKSDGTYEFYINLDKFQNSCYQSSLLSHEEAVSRFNKTLSSLKETYTKTEERLKSASNKVVKKILKEDITRTKQNIWEIEGKILDHEKAAKAGEKVLYDLSYSRFENIPEQIQCAIHHEFGHYVDSILNRPSEKINVCAASKYGKTVSTENFAEWYALYRMKANVEIPQQLVEVFEKYNKSIMTE